MSSVKWQQFYLSLNVIKDQDISRLVDLTFPEHSMLTMGGTNSTMMFYIYMGQVTKLRLSCYLVLLSIDSKTR